MRYGMIIRAPLDETLYECFMAEEFKEGRSKVDIKKKKACLEFDIKADDAVALRAAANGISKLLLVYEKMKVQDGR